MNFFPSRYSFIVSDEFDAKVLLCAQGSLRKLCALKGGQGKFNARAVLSETCAIEKLGA